MSDTPTRRVVLSWLSAGAAVGCSPATMGLPTKSSFDDEASGTALAGGDTDTAAPTDTADSGGAFDTADALDSADSGSTGGTTDTGDAVSDFTCDQADTPLPSECTASPPQGEGPYYLDTVPEGAEMNRRGAEGIPLTVDLRILDAACQPLAGVVVDLWHADEAEEYDMSGDHHCRGRLTTAADGTVCFSTLRPPPYGDDMGNFLPAHLHLNLLVDDVKVLTTQLYFSDCPYLAGSPPELVCTPEFHSSGSQKVQADLVLPIFG